MSEFINKSKIAKLEQSNSELLIEVSNLKKEILELNEELESLREQSPEETKKLREQLNEYINKEENLKEKIYSISKRIKNSRNNEHLIKELFSSFQIINIDDIDKIIEKNYKNKSRIKSINSFILGIIVSLIFWFIFNYLENKVFYSKLVDNIIK